MEWLNRSGNQRSSSIGIGSQSQQAAFSQRGGEEKKSENVLAYLDGRPRNVVT